MVIDIGKLRQGTQEQITDTKAVQSAIDRCAESGGGDVVFSAGEYVLATVFLKSNVHIILEDGAVVFGTEKFDEYMPDEKVDYPLYQDASHSFFHCSMFVGIDCENISIVGKGTIDMRSVWDEQNVRAMYYRGAKTIALKNCRHVEIADITVLNSTDLALYFAGCENVNVCGVKMCVHIDGISPDNSKRVTIKNCDIECGDDGIVFKSSYTLNRLDICEDIVVENCRVKSRCNAVKFGTETNGGFRNILIENIQIYETRISGIAIESVDGAVIDGVTIKNVRMRNVNAPIFIHLGKRMRGPKGLEIGKIRNVLLENITAEGPYEAYEIIPHNYAAYTRGDNFQEPWRFWKKDIARKDGAWQMTSNVCGLEGHPLENLTFRNVSLILDGRVQEYESEVPEVAQDYPEVYVYGRILPAKGIFFRYIDGLNLENVSVKTYHRDVRQDFVFKDVVGLARKNRR